MTKNTTASPTECQQVQEEIPYIEGKEGEIGIVLSIPHGGLLDPECMPERQCQCANKDHKKCPVVLVNDGFTLDLGFRIEESIQEHTGLQPYLIINNIRRAKMDPNREESIGAQQNPHAIRAFNDYHQLLEDIKSKLNRCLLIDLHGRVKNDSINQLGYCLNRSSLTRISKDCDQQTASSIASLAKDKPNENLITGPMSLGAFMSRQGLIAVPSPQNPEPNGEDAYFSGGYITQRHGCDGNGMDGIQLEIPRDLRIEGGEEGRQRIGHTLGKVISDFYHFHYIQK